MSRLLLPLLFTSIFSFVHAASNGNVVVTTDAFSTCKQGGNLTLAPDTCVSAPTTKQYDSNSFDPMAFHELSIAQYATCDNGTTATFIIYQDLACQDVMGIYDETQVLGSQTSYLGTCYGLLEFRSAAFSCGGGTISRQKTTTVASLNTVTAATTVPYVSTAENPFVTSTRRSTTSASSASIPALSYYPSVPTSSMNASTSISRYSNSSTATAATQPSRTTGIPAATFTGDAMQLQAGAKMGLLAFIITILLSI